MKILAADLKELAVGTNVRITIKEEKASIWSEDDAMRKYPILVKCEYSGVTAYDGSCNLTSWRHLFHPDDAGTYICGDSLTDTYFEFDLLDDMMRANNQGLAVCFKCGTKTQKVDSGMFSVWDVCPRCKI